MSKSKKHSKTRKLILVISVIILVSVGSLAIYYIQYLPDQTKSGNNNVVSAGKPLEGGSGGDIQSLNNYYKEAISAFKAGDKQKAKELAKKGLDVNSQLTIEQRQQIPGQTDVIINLERIQAGKGPM